MATTSSLQKSINQASQRTKAPTASSLLKQTLGRDDIQRRFREVLKDKAPQFMSSIVNVVNSNKQLQKVNAMSVISSAMVAATMDLPIDQNLGYMWLVPYGNTATPQMGYKGYIQLALRTGQYEAINAAEVYEGELESWNRLTEEIKLNPNGRTSDTVIGYFGYFKLINGFEKKVYWSVDEITAHRRKFSKMSSGAKPSGVWASNFDAMAKKTVIRNMLSKWGILSVQMQNAVTKDEKPQTFDEDMNPMNDPKSVDATEDDTEDDSAENVAPQTDLTKQTDAADFLAKEGIE
ncbi:recombinase RecT [Loigolactobacillus backii]|uniref:recombinase RecT n=1 Tax=Loigolactobacillus backii TaxID=375175 RepID=UPI0022FD4B2A|nr:recombinase RecT [Loigolactobacillus backii]MDA5386495.1 recombinase RecT [Loigolactobacillus backii]MDA5389022.1 recombinase RecT [Loigolactobacillus backii]